MQRYKFYLVIAITMAAVFCVFLGMQEEQKVEIVYDNIPNPWDISVMHNNQIPIFASNIIKVIHDTVTGERKYPSVDTINYFIEKIRGANFNGVVVNLTPAEKQLLYDDFTNNFFLAINKSHNTDDKQSLKVMVSDRRIEEENHLKILQIFKEIYSDPSVIGFYVDEPFSKEFDKLSLISQNFNDTTSWFFDKLFYVNLFGIPVFKNYEAYVNNWIAKAYPRLLSFDHYAVWDDSLAQKSGNDIGFDWGRDYYTNLQLFRDYSHNYNIPFWNWILVHKHFSTYSKRYYRRATAADIKFQIFSSLAYGSKGILYYNFWNPDIKFNNNGWNEEDGVLNFDGSESDLYLPVKEINRKAQDFGSILIKLFNVGVYHKTNLNIKRNNQLEIVELTEEPLFEKYSDEINKKYGIRLVEWNDTSKLNSAELKNKIVTAIDNPFALIGLFMDAEKDYDGTYYLLCVNKNRFNSEKITIHFEKNNIPQYSEITGINTLPEITRDQSGVAITIHLEPGDAELFLITGK